MGWLAIFVGFLAPLVLAAFVVEVLTPAWVRRLRALEAGRAAQRKNHG
jgi:hypothetical protein